MIKSMLFAGCSFTWGQSLHYYGEFPDDEHPRDGMFYEDRVRVHHYQYNVDNRFATSVASYFGKKPVVAANNGGDNYNSIKWMRKLLDGGDIGHNQKVVAVDDIDCIIFQTTSFGRAWHSHDVDENQQIVMIDEFIDYVESMGIMIRFIHFDWEEWTMPQTVKDRTIKFDDKWSWYHIVHQSGMNMENPTPKDFDDRIVAHNFPKTGDSHFNLKGHQYLHDIIVENLIQSGYGEEYNTLRKPKFIESDFYIRYRDYSHLLQYYNNNDSSKRIQQILLYSKDKDSTAYDLDYTDKNIEPIKTKLDKYGLLNMWMMIYPPNSSVGWHQDGLNHYRYVYEIAKTDEGGFEWILGNRFLRIREFGEEDTLMIGDYIHRFVNESDSDTRISLVFDTEENLEIEREFTDVNEEQWNAKN